MLMLSAMIDNQEDMSKFLRLYEKYKRMMYSVAYDISKNTHDAEDIVENSLIKVIEILHSIDAGDIDKSRGKNLMITITKNTAIDHTRKNENKVIPCDYMEQLQNGKSAEELYIDMENYQEVIAYLDKLEEKYRDVLRLRILHGLNAKETGKLLGITEYNVNTRFMRAKAMLAQRLGGERKDGG